MQQNINALLGEVAFKIGTMKEARRLFAEQLAPDFNLFDYLRADELGFSACLASLLDPTGKHGQGPAFLDAFLKTVAQKATWAKSSESCRTRTEVDANGRLDIYLEFREGVIGIENKPWAGDQAGQLSRYADHLKKVRPDGNWLLLFFCDREPSKQSITPPIEEAHFNWCKYAEIVSWLHLCAGNAKALTVRIFIEELSKFIQTKVSGELEMSDAKETCDSILKSKSSFGAAMQISRAINSAKTKLLEKFRTDLTAQLESHGFHLVWDKDLETSWKSAVGFGVKFRPEQNLYLRFEFASSDLRGLFWGIKKEDTVTKKELELWGQIRGLMLDKFKAGEESDYFPWYTSTLQKTGLESAFENWSVNELPWLMLLDDGENYFAKSVCKFAIKFRDLIGKDVVLLLPATLKITNPDCPPAVPKR